ncbi:NAD-dependent epimerase [Kangiella sp. TOML190]|uniref:NAD-dependent epimerase n=1 Tax=Kangiella sp. TOML190 TaxID=2931351 RepID=UPI0020414020|nr:NAD-dependent epimerase [Kangiella sp. TOML190]
MAKSKILVTGCAGFIGFHVAKQLLDSGIEVFGLDNINDYYSVELKQDRLNILRDYAQFEFAKIDVADTQSIEKLAREQQFEVIIHLAAQAGVRYSIDHPHEYSKSNLVGFVNILELARTQRVKHLLYASSSSVYGLNSQLPYSPDNAVDHPISLYAATKKSNELMAHTYSHLYQIATTGMRFFTVYGPWGRPDMAPMKFASAISKGKTIDIYNHGEMSRDFTYIDDVVEGVIRLIDKPPAADLEWSSQPKPSSSCNPYRVVNIGYGNPIQLLDFVELLEESLSVAANKNFLPMQDGDVQKTWADTDSLYEITGYKPQVALDKGIEIFADWFKRYYLVS